jgi:hydroxypyruvate reductase
MNTSRHLRAHAEDIWRAGVAAVDSERLVANAVRRRKDVLEICGHELRLTEVGRIAVVGAGKAGAGMAAAVERAVGRDVLADRLIGWVNVPADCVRPLTKIHLHAARPAGVNEPTADGVAGTAEILRIVSRLEPRDVCIVLLSGGGSALLPAPIDGITLEDKQAVTRHLMRAGASINSLNCVRKQLSRVKGGGLARAARAGHVITLVISDVIGDPLEVIASGPTVSDTSTPAEALGILEQYAGETRATEAIPASVWHVLREAARREAAPRTVPGTVSTHVIGNNALALEHAARRARDLGYHVHSLGSENAGEACAAGRELADLCVAIRDGHRPIALPACVLSGGEPVVHVVPTEAPRRGGRNQEVVLAAIERLWDDGMERIALLSGGTDGEDGPTDAAGAVGDAALLCEARAGHMSPAGFLAINNSYPFFERLGGLLKTGPTHTNVMDLRVAIVDSREPPG